MITLRHTALGRDRWTRDQPEAETYKRLQTTVTRERYSCPFINQAVRFIILNRIGGEWPKSSVYFKRYKIKFIILRRGI
jgi:hypothetical protein